MWNINTLHGWRDEAIAILQITFWVFLNENYCILIQIWLNFVSKNLIDNKSAWVQIMAWCRTVDTPLSGPIIINSSFAWVDLTATPSTEVARDSEEYYKMGNPTETEISRNFVHP